MAPFAPHSTFGEATEKNKRAAQQQMSVDGHPLKKTILSVAASEENKLSSIAIQYTDSFNEPGLTAGEGELPHILDISGTQITLVDAPRPIIYMIERERELDVTRIINDVYDVIFHGLPYAKLFRKVEMQDEDGVWTVDLRFRSRTEKRKKYVLSQWLSKLKKEAATLRARPYHWIIRDKDGDHRINDEYYRPDSYFTSYSMMAGLAKLAEEGVF